MSALPIIETHKSPPGPLMQCVLELTDPYSVKPVIMVSALLVRSVCLVNFDVPSASGSHLARLVVFPIHPLFWQAVIWNGSFSQMSFSHVDPVLSSMNTFRSMDGETLKRAWVDLTLLGFTQIELKPCGAQMLVTHIDVDEYVGLVADTSVMSTK